MSIKALFIDFSCNFYDKHWVYSLNSRLAKRGIRAQYVNARTFDKALEAVQVNVPNLLLYSAFSSDIDLYKRFDRRAKAVHPAVSVIGGPGPTYDWRCIEDSTIDALCVGEGEEALDDFIDSGFTGGGNIIPRGHDAPVRLCDWVDLDRMPLPSRDIVYSVDPVVAGMSARQFLSGRGCPCSCTYCSNHAFRRMFAGCGPIVRKKSVDYLLDEIAFVRRNHPFTTIVFQDDSFIIDKKWLLEFCSRFPSEIGLPYTCNILANMLNEDMAQALKESGCAAVNWNIESGDDRLRNDVLKRNTSRDRILKTGALLNKYGIRHRTGNLIGLPGETWEQALATLELSIEAKPSLGLANILVPYPGLELTKYAVEHGHFDPETVGPLPHDCSARSVMSIPDDLQLRLQKLHALFPIFVRFPWLYRARAMRRMLFALPRFALRAIHEVLYMWMFASLYRVKASLRKRLGLMRRYLQSLTPMKDTTDHDGQ